MKFKVKDIVLEEIENFLSKDTLLEAEFHGEYHIDRHYGTHVLKPDEEFTRNDPKFPYMTKEEYIKEAKILSESPAAKSTELSEPIVGWVLRRNDREGNRCIKIRQKSKFNPAFNDVVLYTDGPKGDQIFSFMLGRKPKSILRNLEAFVSELPENIDKDEN